MSDASAELLPVPELYRRRVRFEWSVVSAVAVIAAAAIVSSWAPVLVSAVTLFFVVLAVAVMAGLAVLVAFWCRPLPPSAHITRSADRDVAEAANRVRRGEPVQPPELLADASVNVRSGVRALLFGLSFPPVLALSWTMQAGAPALNGFLAVAGPVVLTGVLTGVLAALAWLGVLQRRLDTLERGVVAASAGHAAVDTLPPRPAPADDTDSAGRSSSP